MEEGRHVVRFPSPLLSMIVGVEMSVLEDTHTERRGVLPCPGSKLLLSAELNHAAAAPHIAEEQAAAVCCRLH